ncbi:MAG: phosphoglucosamine mutase [Bernardetiaceae bacterium]
MTLIKSISGIRGTIGGRVGENLTPPDVVRFAAAFGTWARQQHTDTSVRTIVIGRDARTSGEAIAKLVAATLQHLGLDVLDLGLSTTPTVELAVAAEQEAAGGIIITASHNPGHWNALKLLNHHGEFISAADGAAVLEIAEDQHLEYAPKVGTYTYDQTYLDKHIAAVLALPLVDREAIASRGFRVVVDAVNSSGGIAIPALLRALGVSQVEEMFCEPTGVFAHNPEPLPENLTQICSKMTSGDFDLGIVVDPDVDRLALITEDGQAFGEEYTLVAVADYVLGRQGGGNTVSNLSSTQALRLITEKHGGTYTASAVGEVNVVQEMKAQQAIIGGEGNGGIIYPALHYGRDALVGIALFLSHLARFEGSATRLRSTYPNFYIAKKKIELTPDLDIENLLQGIQNKYQQQRISTIDGVKIEFENEWVHLRRSNTEPIIRIYAESQNESTAEHLANKLISDMKEMI